MAAVLVIRARAVDARGISDDSWALVVDGVFRAVGIGESWREHVDRDRLSGSDRIDAAAASELEVVDADGATLTPGFIDLHAHGGGGHSFADGVDAMQAALATHRSHGTTRSVLSFVSGPLDGLATSLRQVAELRAADPLVLGAHAEGPYLSPVRCGAHDPSALRHPSAAEVDDLLDAAAGSLQQMTIAPELPGALDIVERLVESGVCVAVGHTDADYERTRAAFDAGATIATHVFNAMAPIHHRRPGPAVAAIDAGGVTLEVINDGRHLADAVVRLVFGAAAGRVALVTDAMDAAGGPDGEYLLGSQAVSVHDRTAVLRGTDTLAGSTITLDEALRRALAIGISEVDAVTAVTRTPARALGLDDRLGRIAPGYAGDFVLLDSDWRVRRVFAAGEELTLTT
jgi:N-acetylglucosamine-6-phosphate deacetylase